MKQIITDAFILLLSGAAKLKNGKEVECVDKYNYPITIEFPHCPDVTPNYAIVRRCYESEQLAYECEYQNGKLHGLSKWYYKSGQLQYEDEYQDGKLHGLSKGYYESGQLRSEHKNQDGNLHGLSKWYYEDGQLDSEHEY